MGTDEAVTRTGAVMRKETRSLFSAWVGLMLGMGAGTATAGIVPEALYDKASREGSVRVIVQLRVNARPEGELASPEAVTSQRQAIAAAQSVVLRELAGTSYRAVRTYETIPFLALEVSSGALQALEGSALVVGMEEDRLESPQPTPNRPAEDNDRAPAHEKPCLQR